MSREARHAGDKPAADRAGAYATGARLDMTVVPLMLDTGPLLEMLEGLGPLALSPAPEAPPGKHPVCIELWQVREGSPEAGGVDQHRWLEWTGATTGGMFTGPVGAALGAGHGGLMGAREGGRMGARFGPVGWWWGMTTGWMAGALTGSLAGMATATAYGASAAGRNSRTLSEATSRVLGSYHEVAILVPDVVLRSGAGEPHLLVLGMHTDSTLARSLAEFFETGFRKRLASIASRGFERYEARTPGGDLLAIAELVPREPAHWLSAREEPGLSTARRWLAQPFLGHVRAGSFALTHLDRFYDDASVRVAGVSGRLSIGPDFAPGIPPGDYELRPATASHPVGAFQASRVPVKLTYPRAAGLTNFPGESGD